LQYNMLQRTIKSETEPEYEGLEPPLTPAPRTRVDATMLDTDCMS